MQADPEGLAGREGGDLAEKPNPHTGPGRSAAGLGRRTGGRARAAQ